MMIDRVASSIESGVYAMTPDELDRFVVTHTSEISKATPALFIYVPGRERHFGSGVLLQVEDTRFLLTAAHVADDCFHRYKRIFFWHTDIRRSASFGLGTLLLVQDTIRPES